MNKWANEFDVKTKPTFFTKLMLEPREREAAIQPPKKIDDLWKVKCVYGNLLFLGQQNREAATDLFRDLMAFPQKKKST